MLHEFLVVLRDRCIFWTETVRGGCELRGPARRKRTRFFKFLRVPGGDGQKISTRAGL